MDVGEAGIQVFYAGKYGFNFDLDHKLITRSNHHET